ncbi:hypothetical protein DSM106972_077100 [Dulcicalothrix desertica PCC 7102]|uniref:Lasso peptide n=1 Tax=Dulcicalothrix desertica PCC 7102 TaxID=232991 RepID=A0A3S1AH01_9CYAN|nr:lasso peptide [Dulcicalothrix desertica]RUT00262.1 hypothetical protein DSM106972_077100 [Dulcicalothrix desertica PCC 7102]TWH55729.1 hypothetical protein CAL7102_03894 [Dulcicalothrix desertica PCC 7102]
MKKQYSAPELTVHGNVAAITQILGSSSRKDFLFFNGSAVSTGANGASNDVGSRDVCLGSPDPNSPPANCDPQF